MPKLQNRLSENVISSLLSHRGYKRTEICKWLGIKHQSLSKYMEYPAKYFTLAQLEILAGKLDMPFIEFLGLVRGIELGARKTWYK